MSNSGSGAQSAELGRRTACCQRLSALVLVLAAAAGCGGRATSRGGEPGLSTPSDDDASELPAPGDLPREPPSEMNPLPPDAPVEIDIPGVVPICRVSDEGSSFVTTQAQVDRLARCEVIDGDLMLAPLEGTTLDLRPLASLRQVGGDLTLGCNALSSTDGCLGLGGAMELDGLENLESVGSLTIAELGVTSLVPLSGLRSVDGSLTIANCHQLSSLAGLEGIAVGSLSLSFNQKLSSLAGPRIAASADYVVLAGLPVLRDLSSLASVTSVSHLELSYLPLESLDALRNLTDVTELFLHDLPTLSDVSALSRLRELNRLEIWSTGLANIDGLQPARIEELSLMLNPALTHVDTLGGLAHLGSLEAHGNALQRLPVFTHVGSVRFVEVFDNAALEAGPSFPSLYGMTGSIHFGSNPSLQRIDGFPKLQEAELIEIRNNSSLEAVAFPELQRASELHITCNLALPDVSLAPLMQVSSGNRTLEGNQGADALCSE